jgi:hypothetical protein
LNENKDLVLSEQSINVNKFTVSYEKDYNRIKITNPSGKIYYWTPKSNQWYTSSNYLGTEQFKDLDTTKDAKTISTLQSVLKKSGIGASFYLRNTEQGNAFRTWVNKKDPSFSKSINLNVKGVYNNENIYNAWVKYGDEYKKVLNANKPLSSDDKQTQTTIEDLKSKGFDASGAMSMNHAYALAAIRATKKLTDKISERIFGAGDSPYFVCVKKVGSTCSPGSYLITDSFNIGMAEKINSRKDPVSGDLKPPQYTLLTNFYFDWGKITNDLTNAFKYDKNAYNSELFPDGWWNWFTTYWGTDNVTKIKLSQNPKDIKVPGGGGGYPSGELTSSDVHTFLSVVELGAMLLAFIPSPLSPILWGISSAAGIADASTYFYEGDKYTGSMMLALEVIPGGELLKFFKGTKTAVKLGKEGTIDLLKRGSKGSLKGSEEIVYQDLKKELKTLEKEITQLAKKQITKNVVGNLTQNFIKITKNYSTIDKLKVFFHIIGTVWKKTGRLPKMAMSVGGTAVGIDKIYFKRGSITRCTNVCQFYIPINIFNFFKGGLDYPLDLAFSGLFSFDARIGKCLALGGSFGFAKSGHIVFNSIRETHISHATDHISFERLIKLTRNIASLNLALFDVIHRKNYIFDSHHTRVLQKRITPIATFSAFNDSCST